MEPSAVEEATWGSFATTLSYEDTEMMAHLFCAPPDYEQDQHDPSLLASWFSNAAADSPYYCSAENGNTSSNGFGYNSCYLNESDSDPVLNTSPNASQIPEVSIGVSPTPPFGDLTPLNDDMSSNDAMGDSSISLSDFAVVHLDQIPKAKTVSESTGKIVPCKRGQKRTRREGSDSCSYSSEDDLKALQHLSGGRRSTNPQSVYARKRRERINERLRILQNLVPNGTKVDISTMLEEAVHYVKFLQLQIKLLSSDDLWMYAPIAYNGVNIGGLDLNNISPCHEQ